MNLGYGVRSENLLESMGGEHVEGDAGHDATSAPLALEGVGPRSPHHVEALHALVRGGREMEERGEMEMERGEMERKDI